MKLACFPQTVAAAAAPLSFRAIAIAAVTLSLSIGTTLGFLPSLQASQSHIIKLTGCPGCQDECDKYYGWWTRLKDKDGKAQTCVNFDSDPQFHCASTEFQMWFASPNAGDTTNGHQCRTFYCPGAIPGQVKCQNVGSTHGKL